jgi:sporulation protein YlmC with PRC-barrel domain
MRRIAALLAALAFVSEARAEGGLYDYLFEPGALRLNEVIGMEVVTPEGKSLGKISDLLFDRRTDKVERVDLENGSYPVKALVSGDKPGQVVVEVPFRSSGGASALLPATAKPLSPATRELGSPDELVLDLREGRIRPAR